MDPQFFNQVKRLEKMKNNIKPIIKIIKKFGQTELIKNTGKVKTVPGRVKYTIMRKVQFC